MSPGTSKTPMHFKTMAQGDVPQGRNGKHKLIVSTILKDLDQTTPKSSRGSRRLLWFLLIVLFGAFVTLCVNLTWP